MVMIEKIEKPWGSELKFAHTAHYVGKILEVKSGEALSVQVCGRYWLCEERFQVCITRMTAQEMRNGILHEKLKGAFHSLSMSIK